MFEHSKNLDIAQNMINEEMLVLMAHDNKTYPQKGMKASQLPKTDREKQYFGLDELQRARDLIDSELEGKILDTDNSVWEEAPAMYFRQNKEYAFVKDKKPIAIIENTKQNY